MSRRQKTEIPFTRCAVACTSTGALDYFGKIDPHLYQLRMHVHLDTETYQDGTEIDANTFYRWMIDNPSQLPKTSPADLSETIEFFMDLHKKGYNDVIVVTIASALSESANIIRQASVLLSRRMRIHMLDSGTACAPEGALAIKAAKMLNAGSSIEQTLHTLSEMAKKCVSFPCVGTLNYLVKSGRMSLIKGFVANILDIKPILQLGNNELSLKETVRHTDKALDAVVNYIGQHMQQHSVSEAYAMYTGNPEMLQQFLTKLKAVTGLTPSSYPITPLVGAYLGPNAVSIGLFE
ncbi:MAG: DegV family protein [Neisseria sp.]|nr:DegV family protein [Neisseria sp.]